MSLSNKLVLIDKESISISLLLSLSNLHNSLLLRKQEGSSIVSITSLKFRTDLNTFIFIS